MPSENPHDTTSHKINQSIHTPECKTRESQNISIPIKDKNDISFLDWKQQSCPLKKNMNNIPDHLDAKQVESRSRSGTDSVSSDMSQ